MELVMDRPATLAEEAGAPILIFDDDPGIRDVISDFLTRHGYRVEGASDARAMEQVLQRTVIDLIVLDVMMPGEDGLSVCRRLSGAPGAPGIEPSSPRV
jgi:two-component system OmpR family response regulator